MPCMLSKIKPPDGEISAYKFPSHAILPKKFIAQVSLGNDRYFVTGNGPSIHIGITAKKDGDCGVLQMPCRFVEVTVFPQCPVTVRGVIVMSHEKLLVAFGHTFLAFIGLGQIRSGGELCQSCVVSTRRVIVGGRRIGPNKIRVFYEDGGIERLEIKQRNTIHLKRIGKRLYIRGGDNKVTCWAERICVSTFFENLSQSPVLLGTSHGQVISSTGRVFFRGGEKGAIRQMVPINEHFIMLLFGDRSIGLLDLRTHVISKRSIHKGRFSAIEDQFQKDVIIVGDIDGTLHSFIVDTKKGSLNLLISSRCEYNDELVAMHPLDKASLACTTAVGSLFVVSRISFMQFDWNLHKGGFSEYRYARNSADKWYFIINGLLFSSWGGKSAIDFVKGTDGATFYNMKYYHYDDFDLVYAYGLYHIFLDCASSLLVGKKKRRRQTLTMERPITSVVATLDHLLVQMETGIFIYELCEKKWEKIVGFEEEEVGKVTAFARVQTDTCTHFFMAWRDGRVFCGKHVTGEETATLSRLDTLDFLAKDYVIAMQSEKKEVFPKPEQNRLYLLTAKSQFLVYTMRTTEGEGKAKEKPEDTFHLEESANYRNLIGRGWDILWSDGFPLLIGFRQNNMNVYKPGEHMLLSTVTMGPRSNYIIHEQSASIILIHDMGKGMVIRNFPKIGRLMITDTRHCSPITHILVLEEYADKRKLEVADFVTADARGRLVMMTVVRGIADSKVTSYGDHQLSGAILAMHVSHGFLLVGTSLGFLYVFGIVDRLLNLVHRSRLHHAITAFVCGPDLLCDCSPDCTSRSTVLSLADGSQQVIVCKKDTPSVTVDSLSLSIHRRVKWLWSVSYGGYNRTISITPEGVLHRDDAKFPPLSRDSVGIGHPQRYSYMNIIPSEDLHLKGEFEISLAGYDDGIFLLTLFELQKRKYLYFLSDKIHSHEIIDVVFWTTDDYKHWKIGTLDKTGVYVQRTLLIDKGVKFVGTPKRWYCPVPQPKALGVLKKRNEVFVVGKGLASRIF